MSEEEKVVAEDIAVAETPIESGSLNISITQFSIDTNSIDNDENISLPLWGRIVTKANDDLWIQSSNFGKAVGWVSNNVNNQEEGEETTTAVENFSFWPPANIKASIEEDGGDGVTTDESWSWTNVANIMPNTVKKAIVENPDDADNAAAAAWEIVLKELAGSEDGSMVSTSSVEYPVSDSGSIPTRSKAIPCTIDHITALVNTTIIVEVYKGTARDPTVDTMVGTAIFGEEKWNGIKLEGTENSLQRALQYPGGIESCLRITLAKSLDEEGQEIDETVLKSPPIVTVKVVADDTLLQFCRGGRTFTALTSSVYLTDDNGERAESVAAAWNLDDQEGKSWENEEFSISCNGPCTGSNEASTIGGGKLYKKDAVPTEREAIDGEKEEEEKEESEGKEENTITAKMENTPELQWSKPSAPITLMKTFIDKDGIENLLHADSSPVWEISVKRKAPEGVEPSEWGNTRAVEMTTFAEIGFLKEAGVSYFGGRFPLEDKLGKIPPPNTEDLDSEGEEEAMIEYNKPKPSPLLFLYLQVDEAIVKLPPPPPEPELFPKDFIAPRVVPDAKPGKKAAEIFREEISSVVATIADEITRLFGSRPSSNNESSREERRRQLLYQLNTGGKYHDFRQRLKRAVSRLVKERFPSKSALSNGSLEHDKFMTDLYAYLMEEVIKVINMAFQNAEGTPDLNNQSEFSESEHEIVGAGGNTKGVLDRMASLALEAELNDEFGRAAKNYQDYVAASEDAAKRRYVRSVAGGGANPWLAYAMFCCRRGDTAKARECCSEAVALSLPDAEGKMAEGGITVRSAPALLLQGSILAEENTELKQSIVMFKAATTENGNPTPEAELAFTLQALCFNMNGQTRKAGKAMLEATCSGKQEIDLYHNAIEYLLQSNLTTQAVIALRLSAAAGTEGGIGKDDNGMSDSLAWTAMKMTREQRIRHMWLCGLTYMYMCDLDGAQKALEAAIELEEKCPEAWSLLGHLKFTQGKSLDARNAYQTALPLLEAQTTEPVLHLTSLVQVYIRLGKIYLEDSNYGSAREVFLRCCKYMPSASVWLGVGKACMKIGNMQEAEEALAEANIVDNKNPLVWGHLALVCLKSTPPRNTEADQSVRQAMKLNLIEAGLLHEMGAAYANNGRFQQAEQLLRRSLAAGGETSSEVRLLLAQVLKYQNKYEVAIKEYQQVLMGGNSSAASKMAAAQGVQDMEKALATNLMKK
jgi:tetratricopeptide (TPR) repeat protein